MKPLVQERASATDTKGTRSERVDAVVVCSDDSLLIEMGPVLGDHYRTHTVDIPADIAGRVEAKRWIGIVDVDCVPDAPDAVARLQMQYHRCPLILIAARPQDWAGVVAHGGALAAIGRDEVATSRLHEALVAAEERLAADTQPGDSAYGADQRISRRHSSALSVRSVLPLIGVLALLALVVIFGSWLHKPRGSAAHPPARAARVQRAPALPARAPVPQASSGEAPSAAAAPAVPAVPTESPNVLALLSAARVAFREQKLLLPRVEGALRGDSALELYMRVLAQDPQNDEALDGLKRLFGIGKERIQSDVATGKLDDANALLGLFRAAGFDSDAVQALQSSVNAARPKWLALHAQQSIAAGDFASADQLIAQLALLHADPATIGLLRGARDDKKLELQLTRMAGDVKSAIKAGALLQPADDNARTRLVAMRNLARTHPVTLATQHALHAAFIDAADHATQELQFEQARQYLDAASDLGTPAQAVEAMRHLQSAMNAVAKYAAAQQALQAQQLEQARAALAAASAAAVAKPAPSPTGSYIAARPTRALHAHYPDGTNAAGYVIVEFTLSSDGSASNLNVVESSPRGVFDRSALDAVRAGRYDTHKLAGGQPSRARILLRFQPN